MKICMINGNMSSDYSSENYPRVPICDDCIQEEEEEIDKAVKNGEEDIDRLIIIEDDYDPAFGDTCYLCGKSKEEEEQEQEKLEEEDDDDDI